MISRIILCLFAALWLFSCGPMDEAVENNSELDSGTSTSYMHRSKYPPNLELGGYECGSGSWYGPAGNGEGQFYGKKMASGVVYSPNIVAVACADPLTDRRQWIVVTNQVNHNTIIVQCLDKGAFRGVWRGHKLYRILDFTKNSMILLTGGKTRPAAGKVDACYRFASKDEVEKFKRNEISRKDFAPVLASEDPTLPQNVAKVEEQKAIAETVTPSSDQGTPKKRCFLFFCSNNSSKESPEEPKEKEFDPFGNFST